MTTRKEAGQSSSPADVPVVGGPEEQSLTARAAVGGRVTAVHRGRHRILLVPCGESGKQLTLAATGRRPCLALQRGGRAASSSVWAALAPSQACGGWQRRDSRVTPDCQRNGRRSTLCRS